MSKENKRVVQYQKLSDALRKEQSRLLDQAASADYFPPKSLMRQIAEIELNISAIDNTIIEMEKK